MNNLNVTISISEDGTYISKEDLAVLRNLGATVSWLNGVLHEVTLNGLSYKYKPRSDAFVLNGSFAGFRYEFQQGFRVDCGHYLKPGDALGWPVMTKESREDSDPPYQRYVGFKVFCKDCFENAVHERSTCLSVREEKDWIDEGI